MEEEGSLTQSSNPLPFVGIKYIYGDFPQQVLFFWITRKTKHDYGLIC